MALDATVGGANANSYATVAELDAYFAEHPLGATWTAAAQTTAQKEARLIHGTRLLDASFLWKGSPTYDDQALAFPRTGLTYPNGTVLPANVIPNQVKYAVFELCYASLTVTLGGTNAAIAAGLKELKASSVTLKFVDGSDFVFTTLTPLAKSFIPLAWYTDPAAPLPMIFEVI